MRMPKPLGARRFNKIQRYDRICLKQNALKTGTFRSSPESAVGAGGRQFESARLDQQNQSDVASTRMTRILDVDRNEDEQNSEGRYVGSPLV